MYFWLVDIYTSVSSPSADFSWTQKGIDLSVKELVINYLDKIKLNSLVNCQYLAKSCLVTESAQVCIA